MAIPGAYGPMSGSDSDDVEDDLSPQTLVGLFGMNAEGDEDGDDLMVDSSDESYVIGVDDEDDDDDEDDEDDEDEDNDNNALNELDEDDGMGGEADSAQTNSEETGAEPRQLQLAYDALTRQILLVDAAGNGTRLTSSHLEGSSLTLASIRRMLEGRFSRTRMLGGEEEEEGEEEEDDDDDEDVTSYWKRRSRKTKQWYDVVTEPVAAGVNLERSGEFGPPAKKYSDSCRKFKNCTPNLASMFNSRKLNTGRISKSTFGDFTVPNSSGTEVAQFQSKVYAGQFSQDGSFFYAACQDYNIYIYDTKSGPRVGKKSVMDPTPVNRRGGYGAYWQQRSSLRTIKKVRAPDHNCSWTITDANLSANNEWLISSSITMRVNLFRTGEAQGWDSVDEDQKTLDFHRSSSYSSRGIWSLRFSNDGKEIVAGASSGNIFVYDIEADRPVLRVRAHQDDVNAVAFADTASSNLLLSGSDDALVKVWDRRSLSGERPSGTLLGHTEGITFVAPKGDGRYCLSNGKDQSMKLWDLRKMMSNEVYDKEGLDKIDFTTGYDYRQNHYPKPKYKQHPNDCSVMTYRGHGVLGTLIRCHFSPTATTDQRYVYSGSSDGIIHIWSLDGRIVQTLDRRNTHPLINKVTGDYNDPADPALRATDNKVNRSHSSTVRDVAWHPYQPYIMSTAWESRAGVEGSIAKHEWIGAAAASARETLEDQAQRCVEEKSK